MWPWDVACVEREFSVYSRVFYRLKLLTIEISEIIASEIIDYPSGTWLYSLNIESYFIHRVALKLPNFSFKLFKTTFQSNHLCCRGCPAFNACSETLERSYEKTLVNILSQHAAMPRHEESIFRLVRDLRVWSWGQASSKLCVGELNYVTGLPRICYCTRLRFFGWLCCVVLTGWFRV